MSRKRVTDQVQMTRLVWALCGMTVSLLWNFRLRKQNWSVRLWDYVLVYSQERKKNNRAIWIRLAVHWASWQEGSDAAMDTMTRPREIAFYRWVGGAW